MMGKLNRCIFLLKMMTYWQNVILFGINLNLIKEFDSESVYSNKFLETKIKSYCDKATDFHNNEIKVLFF